MSCAALPVFTMLKSRCAFVVVVVVPFSCLNWTFSEQVGQGPASPRPPEVDEVVPLLLLVEASPTPELLPLLLVVVPPSSPPPLLLDDELVDPLLVPLLVASSPPPSPPASWLVESVPPPSAAGKPCWLEAAHAATTAPNPRNHGYLDVTSTCLMSSLAVAQTS